MLYLIYRQHQDLTYKGGEGPIVHLEADLHATVQWANAQARRWAFTLSDAGSNYFEDRADLARLHEINWDAVAAQSWSSCKEPKQAEFLLEQSFPWHLIEQIGVQSRQIYTQVAKKKGTNLFSTFSRPDGPLLADRCLSSPAAIGQKQTMGYQIYPLPLNRSEQELANKLDVSFGHSQ